MTRARATLFSLALLLALPACGHDTGSQPSQGPGPITSVGAAIASQDSSVCALGAMVVYRQLPGPGGGGCVCAHLAGRDAQGVANLLTLDASGTRQVLRNIAQGSTTGTWNTTWAGVGCP